MKSISMQKVILSAIMILIGNMIYAQDIEAVRNFNSIEKIKKAFPNWTKTISNTETVRTKAPAIYDDNVLNIEVFIIYYEDESYNISVTKIYKNGYWIDFTPKVLSLSTAIELAEKTGLDKGAAMLRKAYDMGYVGIFEYNEKEYLL